MSKLKDYILDIQEQVWEFFDKDGNFVSKKVSFDNKVQTIKTKKEMVNMFAIVHGLMAKEIAEEEIFAIETGDHFS
tara:strand:+ start:286 stop:513 length:228 start_codon:yes stop_codon:yes gene_type:complete